MISAHEYGGYMSQSDTVITLTLPADGAQEDATLLIQRGELAHLMQFSWSSLDDVATAIHEAEQQLASLEEAPPVLNVALPSAIPSKTMKPPSPTKPKAAELTIPVGKKTRTIPASHLHTPAEQQSTAIQVAGRLMVGGLWDGLTPIQIPDAARTLKAMKHLSDKELRLFQLTDFVSLVPTDAQPDEGAISQAKEEPQGSLSTWQVGQTLTLVSHAHDVDGDPVPFEAGKLVEVDTSVIPLRLWLESADGQHDVWINPDQITV
jgi:hypothetical protein